ncbi:MAG: dethiobiotin synthase [Gammaproteobacteria bacterium]|nr:MAG: dethiobiotin synthase [Gammaproteobacteria bacterium]
MNQQLFVTGTDTEVGKTWVACAVLEAFNQLGYSTAAIKPVAAGCELTSQGYRNSDALALQNAMSVSLPYEQVNPVAVEAAIAPHIAIQLAQQEVSLDGLVEHCSTVLQGDADITVIEGAGGWRVPINDQHTLADLAKALGAPVLLVVGMRLGCLNHAALTVEAIQADGLNCVGWVANILSDDMPYLDDNIKTLKRILPCPCVGEIPFLPNDSAKQIAAYLSPELLLSV